MEDSRRMPSRRDLLRGAAYGAGALVLTPAAGALLAACGGGAGGSGSGGSTQQKTGGTIKWALSQTAPSLHPFRATGAASTEVRSALH
ncbi:MAG: hypothetical protein WAM30_04165, partial [Candidatus Dormiibacterota bacterium]